MIKNDIYQFGLVVNSLGIDEPGFTGLNVELIKNILNKQLSHEQEIEALYYSLTVLQDELIAYATDKNTIIDNDQLNFLINSIRRLLKRNNFPDLKLPFSNYNEFYHHWRELGLTGAGSWATRRNYILSLLKESIILVKERLDIFLFSDLVSPASEPVPIDNWDSLMAEIEELKSRYSAARTPQDFSAVGTACVRVIEWLSRVAYIHSVHGEQSREEPEVSKTDIRIGLVISKGLGGRPNEELRSLAKSSCAVTHRIKHSTTPNALQAGIACDAVILLVSIVNRIENERLKQLTA